MMRPAQFNPSMAAMQNAYQPSIATCKENMDEQRKLNALLSAQAEVFDCCHVKRRSGWRLAIHRPRLFWRHWRLMKFHFRSIKVAFRLAMI